MQSLAKLSTAQQMQCSLYWFIVWSEGRPEDSELQQNKFGSMQEMMGEIE